MKKLLVIDVSNMIYRSFFGSDPLTTSYGLPVQGLHGFVRGMNAVMRDHKPDYVALALEGGGENFRKAIDPNYKANRSEVNEDLKKQLEILPRLIDALGYKTFKAEGFEADDVIGGLTSAILYHTQDIEVGIASSDKDFAQLLTDNRVSLVDLMKGVQLRNGDVFGKYGVNPGQFVDYLAIVGDTADNIKGVEGVGPKGAVKLLNEFGTLEGIYKNVDSIKGATKDKLVASKNNAFLAQKLAKIETNVPLSFQLTDLEYKGPNVEELRKIFKELEFRELEATMLGTGVNLVGGVAIGVRA